jgi:hypothetical protein
MVIFAVTHGIGPSHLELYGNFEEGGKICSRYGVNFYSFLTMAQDVSERQINSLAANSAITICPL